MSTPTSETMVCAVFDAVDLCKVHACDAVQLPAQVKTRLMPARGAARFSAWVDPGFPCSSLAYWTVKVAGAAAVTPPEVAPMLVLPTPVVVAKPAPLGPFAMVATLEEDELQ